MSQEYIEEEDSGFEGVDLDAIAKQFEQKGFFARLADMFKGLQKPKNSREYKLARVELQRLKAPLIAIVAPVLGIIILIVVTQVTGQAKETIVVDIARAEEPEEELKEEDEPPPDDIEPPPQEEVEITVDCPTPGPVSNAPMAPAATAPSQQVSAKPAAQDTVAFVNSPVKMKSMTGSRTPGSIGAATRGGAGYGDAATEATVMKVLWWLKSKQSTDGSWTGGASVIANTAFAVLTYLAHGEYPGSPSPYKKDFGPVVQMAIDFLVNSIYEAGEGKVSMKGVDGNEYAFLIATYALSEAYGMTKNPNCKESALRCLDRIIKGQGPTGGFDYKLNNKSTRDDLSFAGWAIQAMKAGKMAGLHPDGLLEAIKKAINQLQRRAFKGGGFGYTAGGAPTGLTATGCLAMQLLGYGNKPEVASALDYMRDWMPSFEASTMSSKNPGACPQYYSYYAAQCKFQAGMKEGAVKKDETAWHTWNAEMKKLYPSSIIDAGPVKDWTGKDHKSGYFQNKDAHTSRPVMDTCLVALQLMVYYRYLPTTSTKAGKEEAANNEKDAGAGAVDKSDDVDVSVDI